MIYMNFISDRAIWTKLYWIYSNYRLRTGSDGALPTVYWISRKCQGRKRIQCHRRSESITDMNGTYMLIVYCCIDIPFDSMLFL